MSSVPQPRRLRQPRARARRRLTVALAGNPNSGKTTIFNALTGLRQKVANYPASPSRKKTGRCKLPDGTWAERHRHAGTYSLISRCRRARGDGGPPRPRRIRPPDLVVSSSDASNPRRNLFLVCQLI
jgi:ferrous iron transport protein B